MNLSIPSPGAPEGVLEGEVARVTFANEDTGFRVLRVAVEGESELRTVVGVFPPAPPGTRIRATGKQTEDRKHGSQFRAETVLTLAPATLEGMRRYLASGLVPGIGPAFARRIVDAFGERALEVLDRDPQRLRDVPGIGQRRVQAVAKAWAQHRDVSAIMVFLQTHGASPALASRIYKRFGRKSINVVSANPYRLALDVWGVGFKTADAIAQSIGIDKNAPERAQAGVLHSLHEISTRGHAFAARGDLVDFAAELLGCGTQEAEEAIDVLDTTGRVIIEELQGGVRAVYSPELHGAEQRIAQRLAQLAAETPALDHASKAISEFEHRTKIELAPAQREAIAQAASSKVLVITGGPGVGKTTIVRAILTLFDLARVSVAMTAPTGRAAKRLSEATGREAKTIHRLLEFDPRTGNFGRNANNSLNVGAVIVDETSMVALELADSLLQALDDHTRLVLVGDVDQLPSVGPGAVLRDIIDSGEVTTIRLNEVFRQAEGSSIVLNAHRIHAGKLPIGGTGKNDPFYVIERTTPESTVDTIRDLLVRRIRRGFGLDPFRDVQVLTPMKRGPVGTIALNELLQGVLNPTGPHIQKGTRLLRLGDKVMQLRNDYEKEVYNGDIGRIVGVDSAEKNLTVRFDERDVSYAEGDIDELTLAYATSIHKSQGSEYPAVVIPVVTQHFVMLARNLLYTAVTRGKQLVILVADPRALAIALGEARKERRLSYLARRIVDARDKAR
ncbi:MAG: ATP-dependent RecD-like DNA helicase [Polyangiaceae bacterium]